MSIIGNHRPPLVFMESDPMIQSKSNHWISGSFLASISLVFFAILQFGLVDKLGELNPVYFIILILGGLSVSWLILHPITLLWLSTLLTLVVLGITKYFFPEFGQAWWVAYGMSLLLFFPPLLSLLKGQAAKNYDQRLLISLTLLIFIGFISIVINTNPSLQLLVTLKSILPFASIWLLFSFYPVTGEQIQQWLKLLLAIGLIQWVVTLYQYIFIRAERIDHGYGLISASDSVVGTFGGKMLGGGLSGSLALFLVMGLITLISYFRQKLISTRFMLIGSTLLFLPLIFMEVKIIFFYIPVALIILYYRDFISQPLVLLKWIGLLILLVTCLFILYQSLHWSVKNQSVSESIQDSFSYSFSESSSDFQLKKGVMSRRQTLNYWYEQHHLSEPVALFFGHGLGASRTTGLINGEAAKQHTPLKIDRTGISILLWDIGVLGLFMVLVTLWIAFRQASFLSKHYSDKSWQSAIAYSLYAFFPLVGMSLLYRNDFPYTAPSMFMLMSAFGLLAWLQRDYYANHT